MRVLERFRGAVDKHAKQVVEVGWILQSDSALFIWEAPQPITQAPSVPPQHAKSVAFCPAVVDHEARLLEVPCPFDLELGLRFEDDGEPVLVDLAGDQSSVRMRHLRDMTALVARKEWRHPNRPIIQITTPYTFVADDNVYLVQLPPIQYYRDPPLPGLLIGGRMPVDVWPRPLMWAFEWFDTRKSVLLRRGEPWFYVRFEPPNPNQRVRVVEAQMTPELKAYLDGISGVTNYVKKTFSLFPTARQRRPKQLLVKVRRNK